MSADAAPPARRSALSIVVPEAESLVSSFRSRFAAESVAKRIPAHITVLFPFAAVERLDPELVAASRRHFAGIPSFDAQLVSVGRFVEHVWLAPEPRSTFVDLIGDTCRRFPAFAPYDGAFAEPAPHLTIGQASPKTSVEALVEAAEMELAPLLPLAFRVSSIWLLEEQADGGWEQTVELPLGA